MRLPRLAAALAALTALAAPKLAAANGGNSHTWITQHAIEHLPDGALKELLSRPELQGALVNGSVFPDGGYVVDDAYGETAHWEPFVEAYLGWMRDTFDKPYGRGGAAEHVAFLMGLASHGMADQVFDATFMESARIEDAAGWSEDLLTGFDTMTDVLLVADTGANYLDYQPWVPAAELSALYRDRLGYEVSPDTLWSTQELLHRFVLNYAVSTASDPAEVAEAAARYPWAAANLMDPSQVGSPPCEGEVVAAYFLALWDRLHGESGEQNFVIATYPRVGTAGHPTDSADPSSQVVIVYGSGIQRAQLAGRYAVVDSTGRSYDLAVDTQWGASDANLVRLRPLDDWAAGETFTVTQQAGLETIDGFALPAWSFTFSTALDADDPLDPTDDPTPHVGEPDVGEAPTTGCAAGGAGGGAGLALALAGLAGRRRRRRR